MVENRELPDFRDLLNSLNHGPAIGIGFVDMSMTWSGGGEVSHVGDGARMRG
jgi:hypothetical protein